MTAYVKERNSKVDPQAFIDFYASKGWLVGKTPMKTGKRLAVMLRNGTGGTNRSMLTDERSRTSMESQGMPPLAAGMKKVLGEMGNCLN